MSRNSVFSPSFQSVSLTKAFIEVFPIFDSHKKTLDGISQDIIALEDYLQSKCVQYFLFLIDSPEGYPGSEWTISWDLAKNGKMRLMYKFWYYPDASESNDLKDDVLLDSEDCFKKTPLIEGSLEHRILLFPYLPAFLKAVADRANAELAEMHVVVPTLPSIR